MRRMRRMRCPGMINSDPNEFIPEIVKSLNPVVCVAGGTLLAIKEVVALGKRVTYVELVELLSIRTSRLRHHLLLGFHLSSVHPLREAVERMGRAQRAGVDSDHRTS